LSVGAEIFHGIIKKVVLGLDVKNSKKNAQKVVSIFTLKNGKNTPFWASQMAITKKLLFR
jgi:hypothetical protein